ncbi:phage integrase central domain-containing protein [Pseudomonas citronellolis]|uniref:phage integrase central domain-containing protein n=1 Tax=Pseudomonas citronellolis TaxID=53408 RepID=UPI003F7E6A45
MAERDASRLALQLDSQSFEAIAREWHAYRKPRWAASTADKTLAYLESDLIPALGKLTHSHSHSHSHCPGIQRPDQGVTHDDFSTAPRSADRIGLPAESGALLPRSAARHLWSAGLVA